MAHPGSVGQVAVTADLPACDDEIQQLLKQFGFAVPLGHLDQAIDAHFRSDWAAANSQIRSFLEGLVSDIAHRIEPQLKGQSPAANNCRAVLAEH